MKNILLVLFTILLSSCGGGGGGGPEGTYKDSYSNFLGTKYYRVLNINSDGTWNHSVYKEGETERNGITDSNGYNDSGRWSFKNEEFISYGEVSYKEVLVLTDTYDISSKFFFSSGCLRHIPLTSEEKQDKNYRESLGVTWNHPTDKLFCVGCDSYSLCK